MSYHTTLPGPWKTMADAAGGVGALAELLGATRSLLQQWGRGDIRPSGPARVLIRRVAADLQVDSPV